MIEIEAYQPTGLETLISFVEALRDHERAFVKELVPGDQIAATYAGFLHREVAEHDGCILIARKDGRAIGFVCGWVEEDGDLLLDDRFRRYGYVSDIFVEAKARRQGVASALLQSVETRLWALGCQRLRICSKAANTPAAQSYVNLGYRPYEIIFWKDLQ
jgi:GNAT superfamily N-acetyltransferase